MANVRNTLNFHSPKTASQWIVFLAATSIALSSPYGTRQFNKELRKYLEQKSHSDKKDRLSLGSQNISQALYKLRKRHIIRIAEKNGKATILLTEKGKVKKLAHDLERLTITKQPTWDKRWRLVMFDIPESKKQMREAFRRKIKRLGFHQFQKSVWIYPYPCENELDFIAEFLGINKYLTLLTVLIDNDRPLRRRFKL